jgi:peptidyl-prolyl cis-trans isomerase C
MRILKYCIVLLVLSIPLGISFAQSKELAGVNGFTITEEDFKSRFGLLGPVMQKRIDKEAFLETLITEELLVQEARKSKLYEKEDYKLKVEAISRELLADFYLRQYLKEHNTEETQKKYYEENKDKYKRPEMKRIAVIRLRTEAEAENILKKAQSGEDFSGLAMNYSTGPAALKGGDFGFRTREHLRKEFADIVFTMKKGEIKGPIKTEEGYHIIKVIDQREAGIAPFEEVKQKVAEACAKKLIDERISELRKAATIHKDSAELKNLKIN